VTVLRIFYRERNPLPDSGKIASPYPAFIYYFVMAVGQAGAGRTSMFNKKNVIVNSRTMITIFWDKRNPGSITTPYLNISLLN
jgi:hypothetical protein